jgi:type IX secretion system PorP/SprF family membrane protein
MKKYIIGSFLIIVAATVSGQQLHTSSLYDMQGVFHNAAMAGLRPANFVGITYRTQWSGIAGAPTTATAFGSFELPKPGIGIGANIYSDKTGPTSHTGLQLNLAKHIVLGNNSKLSLGLETRLQQFSIDRAQLSAALGSDPALGSAENDFKYDAGFGIAYASEKLELGASVSQLVQSELDFYSGNLKREEVARLYRHYYFHGAYHWNTDGVTTISPNFLFIYLPNAPTEFQVGARVEHNKTFWWGVGYRSGQSFMVSAGLNINKKLTLGYAYDDYLTPISTFDGGSGGHEFILRYTLAK